MPTSNEALAAKIDGLAALVQMFRKDQANQFSRVCDQLEAMNGRQRDNVRGISANERDIATLRVYVDQSTNRKGTFLGILGFLEALGAFVAGLVFRP